MKIRCQLLAACLILFTGFTALLAAQSVSTAQIQESQR